MSKSREKKRARAETTAAAEIARAASENARAAGDELRAGAARLDAIVRQHSGASMGQKAGRVAEEWHAATFNADAAGKGLSVRARTTASIGQPCAASDIVLSNGAPPVQVKYHATPASNATHLARPQYDGMQKVVPSDQLSSVRSHAARRVEATKITRPTRSQSMAHTARTASDRVAAGGAESKPLSTTGARELAQDPKNLSGMASRIELTAAAKSGALSGAAVGAAVSVAVSAKAVWTGESTVGEAAVRSVAATAQGAAMGAGTAVLASAATRAMAQAGLKTLARGSAPVAVATTVLEIAGNAVDLARGQGDASAFAVKTAKAAGRGAGAWAGAEFGGLIGTAVCPGLGTAVGGIVGGLLAGFGLSRLL